MKIVRIEKNTVANDFWLSFFVYFTLLFFYLKKKILGSQAPCSSNKLFYDTYNPEDDNLF